VNNVFILSVLEDSPQRTESIFPKGQVQCTVASMNRTRYLRQNFPWICGALLIACLLWPGTLRPMSEALLGTDQTSSFGQIDFIEYWSAYQLIQAGKDPYSPISMREEQATVRPTEEPLMMWNPPWTVLVMSPVLAQDFKSAARTWLAINLLCVGGIIALAFRLFPFAKGPLVACILSFPPLWDTLRLGQVTIVLALMCMLAWYAMVRNRWFLAGGSLALLSIKPHLVLLAALLLFWYATKFGQLRLIIGVIFGGAALVLSSKFFFPQSLHAWFESVVFAGAPPGVIHPSQWITATIPSVLKAYLAPELGLAPLPFLYLIVALSGIVLLLWAIRAARNISAKGDFPIALTSSFVFAPFGWFFDQVIALPTVVQLATRYPNVVIGIHLAATLFIGRYAQFQSQMFWLPIVFLTLSFLDRSSRERNIQGL
jgi:hypothetical protein